MKHSHTAWVHVEAPLGPNSYAAQPTTPLLITIQKSFCFALLGDPLFVLNTSVYPMLILLSNSRASVQQMGLAWVF